MAKRDDKKGLKEVKHEERMDYLYNPKFVSGTRILDCTPQQGKCPLAKTHDCGLDCYFQNSWYAPEYKPNIPPKELAKNKIIRFNSGNDSNNQRKLVIEVAKQFEDFFFNTSIPRFDFPGPVVFTCNSKKTNEEFTGVKAPINLMFVRFRINAWNLILAESAIVAYEKQNMPVVLTFMRYQPKDRIPDDYLKDYIIKKNVTNSYFMIRKSKRKEILENFRSRYKNVFQCGTYDSSYCGDCRNCEKFYYRTKSKIKN